MCKLETKMKNKTELINKTIHLILAIQIMINSEISTSIMEE